MPTKKRVKDQMGREIEFNFPPKRIVSLVPSQTELLYDLGLNEEVVGQTIFCIHPAEQHQKKPRVGGTKKLNIEKIYALQPDLIIGNKEENEESQIKELMKHYPVWMSDIKTLDDALDMIKKVGKLVDKEEKSIELTNKIQSAFQELQTNPANGGAKLKTAYFIWYEPYMLAGTDTFIHDMLSRCGLLNIAADIDGNSRYPEITALGLQQANTHLALLSSEPYPFKQKHVDELQNLIPHAKVILVDGEMFSWYGSRLLKSVKYFKDLL